MAEAVPAAAVETIENLGSYNHDLSTKVVSSFV